MCTASESGPDPIIATALPRQVSNGLDLPQQHPSCLCRDLSNSKVGVQHAFNIRTPVFRYRFLPSTLALTPFMALCACTDGDLFHQQRRSLCHGPSSTARLCAYQGMWTYSFEACLLQQLLAPFRPFYFRHHSTVAHRLHGYMHTQTRASFKSTRRYFSSPTLVNSKVGR